MAPITDQEWTDLVEHELPQHSDPVIQRYLESRGALMAQDQKRHSDSSFRNALSPIARKACDLVTRIRNAQRESTISDHVREETATWQIIRRMPKGALLGAHCHTLADVDHLISVCLSTPGMHISCSNGHLATADARKSADISIRFKASSDKSSIWTTDYKPGTFTPLTEAADSYPEGGRQSFVNWLKNRCMVTEQDRNLGDIRAASSRCATIVGEMIHYEPIWRAYLQRLMNTLVGDGIYWLELRITPLAYFREGSELPEPDHDHMFRAIGEEVAKFQAFDQGRQFWGLRLIWSATRGQDPRLIIEDADDCIANKILWPDLVAGYDLGQSELSGLSLASHLPELFWFRKQCVLERIQIPLFLGDGDATEGDLFDALLLGTRRIGNASTLYKHPALVEGVRDKRILVEACPVSDGRSVSAGTLKHHPLPALLAQGVPCALCADDAGILLSQDGAPRMTNIFWGVLQAWEDMDLAGLGSLAENSVRWAAFEDQNPEAWAQDVRAASMGNGVKAARLQQWAVEWERFCLWIVTEYSDAYGDDTDVAE